MNQRVTHAGISHIMSPSQLVCSRGRTQVTSSMPIPLHHATYGACKTLPHQARRPSDLGLIGLVAGAQLLDGALDERRICGGRL